MKKIVMEIEEIMINRIMVIAMMIDDDHDDDHDW